jgi:hypothetical protein
VSAYRLAKDDIGNTLLVIVTATNSAGFTTANSAPTDVVAEGAAADQMTDWSAASPVTCRSWSAVWSRKGVDFLARGV